MKHNAADELHIEMSHAEGPLRCFPDHGKGLGQKLVEDGLFDAAQLGWVRDALDALPDDASEFVGLAPELRIRETADRRFKRVDRIETRLDALELALIVGSKDLLEDRSYHELIFSVCL